MEMAANVDTIICDYNYVFSPHALGSRVTKLRLAEKEKPNVIIDEVHNLPVRAMDYYSGTLSVVIFENALKYVDKIPEALQNTFKMVLKECTTIILEYGENKVGRPYVITLSLKRFTDHTVAMRDFLVSYLESDAVISSGDIVLYIYHYWTDFITTLEWVVNGREEFFTSYHPNPPCIKITCCNAAEMLKTTYDNFKQIVGFSATLKPFDFYSQLIGLHTSKLKIEEVFSPFPKSNRKLIIIPQISSRYADRARNYPRIAEVIARITQLKKGNYFAFFPSFDFMDNVFRFYKSTENINLICQDRSMRQIEVEKLLKTLTAQDKSHIVFGVQGGVLAEGIDYPGNLGIGVFVVGTPLPNFNWEREKMKEYYQSKYGKGEEFAYVYPAMAKAIQAAGRVIRSEQDTGLIVLMDNRFLQPNYSQCMPQDWFEEEPSEIISTAILNDVAQFWMQEE
jgi:DNA excision repair protein ERCC-2